MHRDEEDGGGGGDGTRRRIIRFITVYFEGWTDNGALD